MDEGYGHVEKKFTESKKNPPTLPPHLKYTPLNTNVNYKEKEDHDPSVVPMPLMVTLGHTYFARGENIESIGVSLRYREKYSTLVLYKPI